MSAAMSGSEEAGGGRGCSVLPKLGVATDWVTDQDREAWIKTSGMDAVDQ